LRCANAAQAFRFFQEEAHARIGSPQGWNTAFAANRRTAPPAASRGNACICSVLRSGHARYSQASRHAATSPDRGAPGPACRLSLHISGKRRMTYCLCSRAARIGSKRRRDPGRRGNKPEPLPAQGTS
jgi:hypothetical protein